MSFFQFLGNMAGGAATAARPFVDDYIRQKNEDKESQKITDTLNTMSNNKPMYSEADIGAMGADADRWEKQKSEGYFVPDEQMIQASADRDAQQAMRDAKSSFVDQLAGMSPNEALGMFTKEMASNGIKIDKTSLGVFDMLQKGVSSAKDMANAEHDRLLKENTAKAQGIAVESFFKDKPAYAPIFEALKDNNIPVEAAAPLLSTLIKDENSTDSLLNKMLIGQMNIGSREKIASENNETKEILAVIGGSNTQFQNDNLEFKKQQAEEKKIKEQKEEEEKRRVGVITRKDDRSKNAKKILESLPNWNKLSPEEKASGIEGYTNSGKIPTVTVKKVSGSVFGTNDKYYVSWGKNNTKVKSNPTKTDTPNDKVKEKKHDPYGLL